MNNNTVQGIVNLVLEANDGYYTQEQVELLPKELLGRSIESQDYGIVRTIDKLRFTKTEELAKCLGLSAQWKNNKGECRKLNKVTHAELNSLPKELEILRKEIRFLFNVAATLLHS